MVFVKEPNNGVWKAKFAQKTSVFATALMFYMTVAISLVGVEQQIFLIMSSINRHDLSFFDMSIMQRAFEYEKSN